MSDAIEYEQLEPSATSARGGEADLERLSEIPMGVSVEIGRAEMTVGDALALRIGSVVTLERASGEPAELFVNGTAIARGEVVVVDDSYGLRITEFLDAERDGEDARQIAASVGELVEASVVDAVADEAHSSVD